VAAGNVFAMQCDFEARQKLDGPEHETQGSYCLKVHKAAKVHLQQCHFHAAQRTAVDLRCPEVTVSHCTFLDCRSSIDCGLNVALQRMYSEHRPSVRILSTSFENSEHLDEVVGVVGRLGPPAVLVRKQFASATVKDCIFQNVNRDAIATNCTSQIIANHITEAATAIWVNGGGNDELEEPQVVSEISKNRLERCGAGILATRLPKVIVQDNEVENVIDVAIHLRHLGHETPTENSRVECNIVRDAHCQVAALMVVKSPVDVLSNTFQQPGRRGIVLEGRGDEMPEFHICDNHITGAKSTGIEIIGKSRMWNEAKSIGYNTEQEIDNRLASIDFQLCTESVPLKEEKKLLAEIQALRKKKTQVNQVQQMEQSLTNFDPGLSMKEQKQAIQHESKVVKPPPLIELSQEEVKTFTEGLGGRPPCESSRKIAHNSISGCGRGVLVQDVPAIVEGNSLAKNNGWAIHLDLRFGGHDTSSSILQNTMVGPFSGRSTGHRSMRLSMPEAGCTTFPGTWPNIQENFLNDDLIRPMVKRRKVEQ